MKKALHFLYVLVGTAVCRVLLIWWNIRDAIFPVHSNSVLFVAHPDDDTLFFHTFIKRNKPYVCLMTDGWSLRRMPCFFKAMRRYGVRYRAYPLDSRDPRDYVLRKNVQRVLRLNQFDIVATHNAEGEYGHEEHIRVHNSVIHNFKKNNGNFTILCPALRKDIENYPLDEKETQEKEYIFNSIYTTESWVLSEEESGTPVWVRHEHLEELK